MFPGRAGAPRLRVPAEADAGNAPRPDISGARAGQGAGARAGRKDSIMMPAGFEPGQVRSAPPAWDERARLAALESYSILDTPPERAFDEVVRLAAQICDTSIAVVNLVAGERQFFKAEIGLGVRETPLDISICAHALLRRGLFVVPDTTRDPRFACNPLVTGAPHL